MDKNTNATIQEEPRDVRALRIARRSTMYIVRTLLFLIMGCIICITALLTAERVSNLYILTSEGMALRADCILADGAQNDLEEYFTLTFLENDPGLKDTTYDHYTITEYNYDLSIEKISVLPWSMSATVTVVEKVNIKGEVNADQLAEGQSATDFPMPKWMPVRYQIRYLNSNGRWYITALEMVEENPVQKPLGTPDLSRSPIPAATPTPAPTDAPTKLPVSTNAADAVTTLQPLSDG
ncbi:MAG: hypothetical protein RRZ24_11730 [Clostridia bacterium]